MRYHNITHDDMLNGEGLRVVLWLSGCEHHCPECQNPVTWDPKDGIPFDEEAKKEIFEELGKDYISGITLSGGDPFHPINRVELPDFLMEIKSRFPQKTIWCYTGYLFEEICDERMLDYIDILVDGRFIYKLAVVTYHWAGSTNQRIIDVQKSLKERRVILYD